MRIAIVAALFLLPSLAFAQTVTGVADVADGDTFNLAGERIRVHGVDAVEGAQECRDDAGTNWRCGDAATRALAGFLNASQPTTCVGVERDRYGRLIADCRRADGIDIASWLVLAGWAVELRQFSKGAFTEYQDAAEAAGRGIWAGDFVMPWDWRQGDRLPPSTSGGRCDIKGNISSSGNRVYHLPQWPSYAGTVIDPKQGERWFCSEAEAIAAGWHAPG